MKRQFIRIGLRWSKSLDAGRLRRACLIVAPLLLAGCTATWEAPVETRTHRPAPAKPVRQSVGSDVYRVKRGDTLFGIAWQTGIDYRAIAAWNRILAPYRIYPGQLLRLKPPTTKQARAPTPPATRKEVRATPAKPSPARPSPSPPLPPSSAKRPPATTAASNQQLAWRWPVDGRVVSVFKADDPLRKGIKIAGRTGQPIFAAEGGKVVYSGSGLIGYGRLIIVKHNDNYLSAYGHNRTILVSEGDQVTKGQKIAEMGTANNGDALLHFEIRRDGKPVDPTRLLPRR